MAKNKFITRGNDTTMATIVCGIVFCVFSFIYLYFYQDDLLAMEQHILSDGLTKYNRLIGALIITLLAWLLQYGIDIATRRSVKFPALNYFPSALLIAILTDISPDIDHGCHSLKWLWLAPLTLIAWGIGSYATACMLANNTEHDRKSPFRIIGENLIIMFFIMIFIGVTANTDRRFHKRMKIEDLIAEGYYDKALEEKTERKDADSITTMLRAYALSKKDMLGEKLFEYPVCGKSEALLPNGTSVRCMLCNEADIYRHVARPLKQRKKPMDYLLWMRKHGYAKEPLEDYLLCGYLLDRQIDKFAKEIAKDDSLGHKKLPKHYREALVLYNHLRSNPIVTYHNDVMEADYLDMQTIIKSNPNATKRKALVEDAYGNTYWYYYFYGNK